MSDERRRILDMLSEGKITVDDAERLLKALNGGSYLEDRVQDAIEGSVNSLGRLGETLTEEIRGGARERVTVVLDEEDEASARDDTFDVGDSPSLDVRSFNGPVRVSAGEPGSIRVRTKLKDPRTVKYSSLQQGDVIKVEATPRGRSSGFLSGLFEQHWGPNIEVTVPVATSVDLATSNGPIELRGTAAPGTVKTSNSRIQIEKLKPESTDAERPWGWNKGVRAVGRDGPRSIPINGAGGGLWLSLGAPMAVLGSGAGAGSAGQHAGEDNRGPGRCDSVGRLGSLVDVSGAVGAVRQAMAGLAIEPGRE